LCGKRILITRAKEEAASFSRDIAMRGGIPVEIPVISFHRWNDATSVRHVLMRLHDYRWVIFTSANGVRFFFQWLREMKHNFPRGVKVAVVGMKTFDVLKRHGVTADIVPGEYVAEKLAECLKTKIKP